MILTISLLAITILCLAFATTRVIGIVGLFLLLNVFPLTTTAAVLIGGAAFHFYQQHRRSKDDFPRKSSSRCD